MKKHATIVGWGLAFMLIPLLFCSCESLREHPAKRWDIYDFTGKKRDIKARSAMNQAVIGGHLDIVRMLVERGADVNSLDAHKWTPLMWAVHYRKDEIAKYLVDNGADVNLKNNDDTTPLSMALSDRQVDLAKYLIEHGADFNTPSELGVSGVSAAINSGNAELAELMIKRGVFIKGAPRGKEYPMIIADGGDWRGEKDVDSQIEPLLPDTIPAIEAAVANGAQGLALRVYKSKDGVLFVNRSPGLSNRGVNAKISEMESKDIAAIGLPAGDGSPTTEKLPSKVPNLNGILKTFHKDVFFILEVPMDAPDRSALALALVDAILDAGVRKSAILASCDFQALRRARDADRGVMISVMSGINDNNLDVAALLRSIGAICYSPNLKFVTRDMIKVLHKAGYLVMAWTDDGIIAPDTAKKAVELDIDGLIARDVESLARVVKHHREETENRGEGK